MTHRLAESTWYMRPFTPTEQQLFLWCGDERQAVTLAHHVELRPNATAEEISLAVTLALVRIKEQISGPTHVEYLGGQRRDTLRGKP